MSESQLNCYELHQGLKLHDWQHSLELGFGSIYIINSVSENGG